VQEARHDGDRTAYSARANAAISSGVILEQKGTQESGGSGR
jgi:hypothetical protein